MGDACLVEQRQRHGAREVEEQSEFHGASQEPFQRRGVEVLEDEGRLSLISLEGERAHDPAALQRTTHLELVLQSLEIPWLWRARAEHLEDHRAMIHTAQGAADNRALPAIECPYGCVRRLAHPDDIAQRRTSASCRARGSPGPGILSSGSNDALADRRVQQQRRITDAYPRSVVVAPARGRFRVHLAAQMRARVPGAERPPASLSWAGRALRRPSYSRRRRCSARAGSQILHLQTDMFVHAGTSSGPWTAQNRPSQRTLL